MPFDLKCLSLNVRGINKSVKRRTFFRWLHKQNHHVIFLQESYCSKALEPIRENEWGGKGFFSHGTNHSKGVITLINPSVNFKLKKSHSRQTRKVRYFKIVTRRESYCSRQHLRI